MAQEDPSGLQVEPGLSSRAPPFLFSPLLLQCLAQRSWYVSPPPPPHPRWLLVWGAVTLRLGSPGGARSLAISAEAHSVERSSKPGGTGPSRQPQRQETGGERLAWTAALHGLCFHDVREAELRVPQIQEATALPSIRVWRQH